MARILLLFMMGMLSVCTSFSYDVRASIYYRPVVLQGHVITPAQLDQLKVGMTSEQVRNLLGTPMLADALHADRWIYQYTVAQGGKIAEQWCMVIYFADNALKSVEHSVSIPFKTKILLPK
ncbi:MAG: outer membrane protein assembly factor BamE [Neisseriales bacterium]|nr:MAG: outer membrane protein assembly factor BamE [Neisseriales bacterium]